ncbi:MAG: LLM class flavin-dependent oxidoreductase [Betaproteobacteria bacterium]|nr:LLM class flavin-dependent oxidoreductase [Betaproteobacteria bacterium]
MRIFHFSEQPYPPAWDMSAPSLRVTPPNEQCDPEVLAGLYHRYLDEWQVADELGFDIMINEHHSTPVCMSAAASVIHGILARVTKRARLLILGVPIANRLDPVRAAEELAMVDVISRGRLEMGFVKGVAYEIPVAARSAVRIMDRFWEAHDLILKAMTTRDGPFAWEGQYFQLRNVNLWPRPFQQPHPPVWITGVSASSVRPIAERGYVLATMFNGYQAKALFESYRKIRGEMGHAHTPPDRFAYLGMVAVAGSEAEARRRAGIMQAFIRSAAVVSAPIRNPPGYMSPRDNARMMKPATQSGFGMMTLDGRAVGLAHASVQDLIDTGLMFVGTPDQVYEQIARYCDVVGGLGNFIAMCQAGELSHEDTVDNLTLFSREVMPRLKERHAAEMVTD